MYEIGEMLDLLKCISSIIGEITRREGNTIGSGKVHIYFTYGQPTWGTLLLSAALTAGYLACCLVRVRLTAGRPVPSEAPEEEE